MPCSLLTIYFPLTCHSIYIVYSIFLLSLTFRTKELLLTIKKVFLGFIQNIWQTSSSMQSLSKIIGKCQRIAWQGWRKSSRKKKVFQQSLNIERTHTPKNSNNFGRFVYSTHTLTHTTIKKYNVLPCPPFSPLPSSTIFFFAKKEMLLYKSRA